MERRRLVGLGGRKLDTVMIPLLQLILKQVVLVFKIVILANVRL